MWWLCMKRVCGFAMAMATRTRADVSGWKQHQWRYALCITTVSGAHTLKRPGQTEAQVEVGSKVVRTPRVYI